MGVLAMFDGDDDQDLDEKERASLVATVTFFAGGDKQLQEGELDAMNKVVRFFAGLDGQIDSKEAIAMGQVLEQSGSSSQAGLLVKKIEDAMSSAYTSVAGT